MSIPTPHDEQLCRALDVLEQAGGDLVTLEDLRRAGVHRPAQAIYELEVSGADIDHVRGPGRRRGLSGYRMTLG